MLYPSYFKLHVRWLYSAPGPHPEGPPPAAFKSAKLICPRSPQSLTPVSSRGLMRDIPVSHQRQPAAVQNALRFVLQPELFRVYTVVMGNSHKTTVAGDLCSAAIFQRQTGIHDSIDKTNHLRQCVAQYHFNTRQHLHHRRCPVPPAGSGNNGSLLSAVCPHPSTTPICCASYQQTVTQSINKRVFNFQIAQKPRLPTK